MRQTTNTPSSKGRSLNDLVGIFRREPLILFLVLGLALFVAERFVRGSGDPESYQIFVGETELQWLSGLWEAQTRRAPTENELRALIDDHVREEILFREALRLGLDRGDTILRRRLAQKMSFLIEDNVAIDEPDETELESYYQDHLERYLEPERFTFLHVYLSRDQRGDDAYAQAVELLAEVKLDTDSWRSLGDPFMLRREYAERSRQEITELFGAKFADEISALEADTWQGPIESVYGYHLVKIAARRESTQPPLADVRGRVVEDFKAERRSAANDQAYQRLRERYEIVSEIEPTGP